MNRENAGAKPTPSPKLPPEAEQEILDALFEGMEIHSSEIAAIGKFNMTPNIKTNKINPFSPKVEGLPQK